MKYPCQYAKLKALLSSDYLLWRTLLYVPKYVLCVPKSNNLMNHEAGNGLWKLSPSPFSLEDFV
jgi:hypothetical protein